MSDKMKICMIAPTFPIKGGISVFATSLGNYMIENGHDLNFVSWKKQCPDFVVKDPYDFTLPKNTHANFWLTWYNPFSWLWTSFRIAWQKPDLLLHQWVSPFFAIHFSFINRFVKLLSRKTKVVYSVHNVFPHEPTKWTRFFQKMGFKNADGFIVHAQSELDKIKQLGITTAKLMTPPATTQEKPTQATRDRVRKEMGFAPTDNVVLFFGYIREYKGLDILIKAMKYVDNAKLVIVGQFNQEESQYQALIDRENVRNKIQIHSGYVAEAEVTHYFQMADLVVFPYRTATFSGPVMTAINHIKPVICTKVGCFVDIVKDGKTGYLVDPENPEQLGASIARYFIEQPDWTANITELNRQYSWEPYVQTLNSFTSK